MTEPVEPVDLAVGWAFPQDHFFATALRDAAERRGLRCQLISFKDALSQLDALQRQQTAFRVYLDRGVQEHAVFFALAATAQAQGALVINDPERYLAASDKALLHRLCSADGLAVPKTLIFDTNVVSDEELGQFVEQVGCPFVMKPTFGYGGFRVEWGRSVSDLRTYLEDETTDICMLQELVTPATINGRIAWFRPLYVAGRTIPMWWDPRREFYWRFGDSAAETAVAAKLQEHTTRLAALLGLEMFTCELVGLPDSPDLLLVDYANHPPDMSAQSEELDGVPDLTVAEAVEALVDRVAAAVE